MPASPAEALPAGGRRLEAGHAESSNAWKNAMKKVPTPGKTVAALLLAGAAAAWGAGARVGGTADIACESLASGGISYATNGNVKLGGTLGQAGFVFVGTNGAAEVQGGFWKMENGCEMYPVALSSFVQATGRVSLTFNVMQGNVYTVASIAREEGGPGAGTQAWTNLVATFTGAGGVGSSTTIHEQVAGFTNLARFYVVRCGVP